MNESKIPKRVSSAILNSLSSGVTPRIGLHYFAVGRKEETFLLLTDLENFSQGGSTFRLIVGRYGAGKSFLLQLLRNIALDQGFVVMDADLSLERRLVGSKGEGLKTYRELMKNLSLKTRPEGGALPVLLEKWISRIQAEVAAPSASFADQAFLDEVERRIFASVNQMEEMVHGFDFASVIRNYWYGYLRDQTELKDNALRWLRGEFDSRAEAKAALGVRVIIDDSTWFDYIKIWSKFVTRIGYSGLIILLDEASNLYKMVSSVARLNNYEKILEIFNDTMQGRISSIGVYMAGTPQFVEDRRRGLYSYEPLRSRLETRNSFLPGKSLPPGTLIHLRVLTMEEIFVLLKRILEIYHTHWEIESFVSDKDLEEFINQVVNKLGARELLTPRE